MEIKSVIQKTISATLVIMFSLALFTFNLACVLAPKKTSDFFEWMNWGRLSISLSREGYRRDQDINTLAALVERAIKYADYEAVCEFVPQLKESGHYADFCEFKDNEGVTEFSDYDSYIEGNYLIAVYNNGKMQECEELLNRHIESPYDALNPIRFLVRYLSGSGKVYDKLVDLLKDRYNRQGTGTEELKNICVDLYTIYLSASDRKNAEYWSNEYTKHKI